MIAMGVTRQNEDQIKTFEDVLCIGFMYML